LRRVLQQKRRPSLWFQLPQLNPRLRPPRRNCSRATAKTGSIIGGNARATRRGAAADCAPSAAAQRESTQSETEKAPPGTLIPRTA